MRKLIILLIIIVFSGIVSFKFTRAKNEIVIGMIVPMEHAAMNEIIDGFKKSINKISNFKIKVLIKNAQGDLNIQKSIILQYINKNVDFFVPIGLCASEMTIKLVKNKPIVFLAADINKKSNNNFLTGIIDELGVKNLDFIQKVYPNIEKITLVYASAQKVFKEAQEVEKYCLNNNIKLQKLMIKDISDMYTLCKSIDNDSRAIFILKDHLVVSSTPLLSKFAKEKNIPLITSDDGSVKNGGSFALGVKEESIGVLGGKIISKILSGTNVKDIPIEYINDLVVFYNEKSLTEQNINLENLKNAVKKMNYKLEKVTNLNSNNIN